MTDDANRKAYLEAGARLAEIANKLGASGRMTPIDICGIFIATGVNGLVDNFGPQTAIEYLRNLASEIESDPQSKPN